jgi:hypothetical protein
MKRQRAARATTEKGDVAKGEVVVVPSTASSHLVHVEESESTARIRDGTPVTPESFMLWRAGYERAVEAKRRADELS